MQEEGDVDALSAGTPVKVAGETPSRGAGEGGWWLFFFAFLEVIFIFITKDTIKYINHNNIERIMKAQLYNMKNNVKITKHIVFYNARGGGGGGCGGGGGGGGGGVVKIESSHKKLRDVERISARLLARKVWAYFT